MASRQLGADTEMKPEDVEKEMTFVGLMAMMDPPRPEVEQAVKQCHEAGIRVIMITGDCGLTAESVARRIGLLEDGRARIVNGGDLEIMFQRPVAEHGQAATGAIRPRFPGAQNAHSRGPQEHGRDRGNDR